jgi:hypothetical protein
MKFCPLVVMGHFSFWAILSVAAADGKRRCAQADVKCTALTPQVTKVWRKPPEAKNSYERGFYLTAPAQPRC